jgi:hypothetical protein
VILSMPISIEQRAAAQTEWKFRPSLSRSR